MPKKANAKNQEVKEEKKSFEEINGEYAGMKLKGRLYPMEESGKGIKRAFMYLEIIPGFNIQCHYVETSNNYFIAFPQYKSGESYKSYVYVEKDSGIQKALDALADAIYNVDK